MPSWRNWISRLTSNQKSVGSSPTGGNKKLFISNSIYYNIIMCYIINIFYRFIMNLTGSVESYGTIENDNVNEYYMMK